VPDCLDVHRVPANDDLGHAVNDRGNCRIGFRTLGDGLAPAHDAVIGRDLDWTQVSRGIEVVGLGVGDGYRFDLGNPYAAPSSGCGSAW